MAGYCPSLAAAVLHEIMTYGPHTKYRSLCQTVVAATSIVIGQVAAYQQLDEAHASQASKDGRTSAPASASTDPPDFLTEPTETKESAPRMAMNAFSALVKSLREVDVTVPRTPLVIALQAAGEVSSAEPSLCDVRLERLFDHWLRDNVLPVPVDMALALPKQPLFPTGVE
jgi:hypothetical protein